MIPGPMDSIERFADHLRVQLPDAEVDVMAYPSGAATLDVRRDGRLFVMAYSPATGFGVDEAHAEGGFLTSYRYVTSEFQTAADKLLQLAATLTNLKSPKLSLIVLYATDLSRSKQFYESLGLQFTPEKHHRGPDHFACQLGDSVFELYPRKLDATAPHSLRIGFEVASVDAAIERLKMAGVQPVTLPEDSAWGRRAVIRDPDGNTVEITSPSQV